MLTSFSGEYHRIRVQRFLQALVDGPLFSHRLLLLGTWNIEDGVPRSGSEARTILGLCAFSWRTGREENGSVCLRSCCSEEVESGHFADEKDRDPCITHHPLPDERSPPLLGFRLGIHRRYLCSIIAVVTVRASTSDLGPHLLVFVHGRLGPRPFDSALELGQVDRDMGRHRLALPLEQALLSLPYPKKSVASECPLQGPASLSEGEPFFTSEF
jgi:hypothetical protein